MYRILQVFIAIILSSLAIESLFAAGCDEIRVDLPDSSTLTTQADRCIAARQAGNPSSITDFVCPQGSFFADNNQVISNETIAYLVAVQISFNQIDTDIQRYMKTLQKTREADPIKWIESINSCSERMTEIYSQICGFGTLEARLNDNKDKLYIKSTTTYPQTLCTDLASRKIQ